jgi:hypothetical protein
VPRSKAARRSRVVPRSKQLGKQPDEAMSSSRGDARRQAGAHRRGEDGPLTRLTDLKGVYV